MAPHADTHLLAAGQGVQLAVRRPFELGLVGGGGGAGTGVPALGLIIDGLDGLADGVEQFVDDVAAIVLLAQPLHLMGEPVREGLRSVEGSAEATASRGAVGGGAHGVDEVAAGFGGPVGVGRRTGPLSWPASECPPSLRRRYAVFLDDCPERGCTDGDEVFALVS